MSCPAESSAPPPAGHALRPGVTLFWGDPLPAAVAPPDALHLAFSLAAPLPAPGGPAPSAAASGAMHFARGLLAPAPGFRAALVFTTAALQELLADDRSPGVDRLRPVLTAPAAPPLALPLTPGARLAVESIRRCPFVGTIRHFALAARAHDLLLEFFAALSAESAGSATAPSSALAARVRAAADTLRTDLAQPPSLTDLARRVGLSETTLKRGFHRVYGTTVFGYLRARRLEHARDLLARGEATVLEAADLVGYSNPSNFAAAFRREFGLNPKEFQLAARRR